MPKENNKVDINKHEIDIDTLFKQNVNDLSAIKELYRKLQDMENKISQIKYIDSNLSNKLKKEYEKLKKIILDENIQAKLTDDINKINSQLDTIENKQSVYIEDFGGKGNDESFDNTTAFLRCLQELKNGGVLKFKSNVYYFNTPIEMNLIDSITILGESEFINNSGTKLVYNGSGYFMTFSAGTRFLTLNNITFEGNKSNNGLLFDGENQPNFRTKLNNITFKNFVKNLNVRTFAYFELNSITFQPCSNTTNFLEIGENGTGTREFFYGDKIIIDGYDTCSGDGIVIHSGLSIYFNKLDIANLLTGKAIYFHTSTSDLIYLVSFKELNVIRCDGGINLFAENNSIEQIEFKDTVIIFRGSSSSEVGLYADRSGANVVSGNFEIKTRKLGNTKPDYIVYFNDNSNGRRTTVNVINNLSGGKIRTGNSYNRVRLKTDDDIFNFRKVLTGDGSTTSFSITLSTTSPFNNPPFAILNTSIAIAFGMTITNSLGGDLLINIKFASPPPEGNFSVFGILSEQGYQS